MFLSRIIDSFQKYNPWTNVYGLARSLLAFGTLLTLIFNDSNALFKSVLGSMDCPSCYGLSRISIFCLLNETSLETARLISIIILLIVISGWRPRLTGVLHWWISFSFFTTSNLLDGGDQVASVLTFLLIPMTLTDSRKFHWNKRKNLKDVNIFFLIIANVTFYVVQLQVAIIYFHAAIGKLAVKEWLDGTALYYFMQDPLFAILPSNLLALFKNSFILTTCTWGVVIFELAVFVSFFMPKKDRTVLLYIGIVFHFLIMLIFGLVTFFFSMAAALLLLLGFTEFNCSWIKRRVFINK